MQRPLGWDVACPGAGAVTSEVKCWTLWGVPVPAACLKTPTEGLLCTGRNWTVNTAFVLHVLFLFWCSALYRHLSEAEAILYLLVRIEQISNTEDQTLTESHFSTNREFVWTKCCARVILCSKFRLRNFGNYLSSLISADCWTLI